jgi:hypothetical protein
MKVQPGVYRHYKGKLYLVIGLVREDATNRMMVLYVPLYDVNGLQFMTVRYVENFTEVLKDDTSGRITRFTRENQ